ncbi:hypothetical protein HDU86_001830 [Geranomyces michiganensis]|nr:hypothetical protein HDU86_001830 [Geranomyces michiganensis]
MSRINNLPPSLKRGGGAIIMLVTITPLLVIALVNGGVGRVTPVGLPIVCAVLSLATWPVYMWDLYEKRELRYRVAAYGTIVLASGAVFVAWQMNGEAQGRAMLAALYVLLLACQIVPALFVTLFGRRIWSSEGEFSWQDLKEEERA